MDIQIRKLSSHDADAFSKLIAVFAIVFEMNTFETPDKNYLQELLSKPDFLVFGATTESHVIGGLTVYVLHRYYSQKPVAYIYDVGILSNYQRKGIGKKLLTALTQYCKESGFEEAFVQAEAADTQAVNFYRGSSFRHEMQAIHFAHFFKHDDNR